MLSQKRRASAIVAGIVLLALAVPVWRHLRASEELVPATVEPSMMTDAQLVEFIHNSLVRHDIPVRDTRVWTDPPGKRRVLLEMLVVSVERVNPVLAHYVGTLAMLFHELNQKRAGLTDYTLYVRDANGRELLWLEADLAHGGSRWRQDPDLTRLWIGPLPKVIHDQEITKLDES